MRHIGQISGKRSRKPSDDEVCRPLRGEPRRTGESQGATKHAFLGSNTIVHARSVFTVSTSNKGHLIDAAFPAGRTPPHRERWTESWRGGPQVLFDGPPGRAYPTLQFISITSAMRTYGSDVATYSSRPEWPVSGDPRLEPNGSWPISTGYRRHPWCVTSQTLASVSSFGSSNVADTNATSTQKDQTSMYAYARALRPQPVANSSTLVTMRIRRGCVTSL
jgi:hypothetical protein